MERHTFRLSVSFHVARCVITIGSLIVPALLSIQYTSTAGTNLAIYWTTWAVSLLVTICNGLATLLKLDKHYYHMHTVREQLISDGWQYLELTGKYSGFHTPSHPPTHENQFVFFCHSIEKIRMKQIQEDYYKLNETQAGQAPCKHDIKETTALIPPTPQQGELALIPESIKKVMQELSKTPVGDGHASKEDEESNKNGEEESVSMQ